MIAHKNRQYLLAPDIGDFPPLERFFTPILTGIEFSEFSED
jgi:hypothetical protein